MRFRKLHLAVAGISPRLALATAAVDDPYLSGFGHRQADRSSAQVLVPFPIRRE